MSSHSSVRIVNYNDVHTFYQDTEEIRASDPIRMNLISTIALSYTQKVVTEKCCWWILFEDEKVIGISLCTGSRPLILSPMPTYASKEFARYLLQQSDSDNDFPAVNGPLEVVDSFLQEYSQSLTTKSPHFGRSPKIRMKQVIYELKELHEPLHIKGSPRLLTLNDLDLGVLYLTEFFHEVLLETNFNIVEFVQSKITLNLFYFWIDLIDDKETIVALGGHSLVVSNSNGEKSVGRIGPIYTRPEYRCHGYGSYLTAYLSSLLLSNYHCRVMLFADESNPSSNKVYSRLGYEVIGDNIEYDFN